MARAAKPRPVLDRELSDLPLELRWRTWMGRVEAVIFASSEPVKRDMLAKVVGDACRLEDLIDDIRLDLRGRPYELVAVSGGWQYRTRPSVADAVLASGVVASPRQELSEHEATVLMAIAYLQPITRSELGRFVGRDVSRDTIAVLRRAELISAGPRAPLPGAPATYVTTPVFLATYGFNTLRELPDMEALEDAGLLEGDKLLDDELPAFGEESEDEEKNEDGSDDDA